MNCRKLDEHISNFDSKMGQFTKRRACGGAGSEGWRGRGRGGGGRCVCVCVGGGGHRGDKAERQPVEYAAKKQITFFPNSATFLIRPNAKRTHESQKLYPLALCGIIDTRRNNLPPSLSLLFFISAADTEIYLRATKAITPGIAPKMLPPPPLSLSVTTANLLL